MGTQRPNKGPFKDPATERRRPYLCQVGQPLRVTTVPTMGQCVQVLRERVARGVDRAILVMAYVLLLQP